MERIFAPWRMVFIKRSEEEKSGKCVLCSLGDGEVSKDSLVLFKGASAYVVMNKFPYTHGHIMVVPYRHTADWASLNEQELKDIGRLTQMGIQVFQKTIEPQGFNIGVNLGRVAGAGIADHVHQHLVPRWAGDVNFMPMFSEVKMISEHLEQTYETLRSGWSQFS